MPISIQHHPDTARCPLYPQVSYSALMHGLKLSNIRLNSKSLSNLALNEPYSFKALVDQVKFMKGMLPGQKAAQQAL